MRPSINQCSCSLFFFCLHAQWSCACALYMSLLLGRWLVRRTVHTIRIKSVNKQNDHLSVSKRRCSRRCLSDKAQKRQNDFGLCSSGPPLSHATRTHNNMWKICQVQQWRKAFRVMKYIIHYVKSQCNYTFSAYLLCFDIWFLTNFW